MMGGFFLFEGMLRKKTEIVSFVKKLYLRLAPAVLFLGLIYLLAGVKELKTLLSLATFSMGFGMPSAVLYWGDWYISVYFWGMIFFFLLLSIPHKAKWALILGLVYFATSLRFHNKLTHEHMYFNWLGGGVVQGIGSIGLGVLTAAVNQHLFLSKQTVIRLFYTMLEVVLAIFILKNLAQDQGLTHIQTLFVFALALILFFRNAGYFSSMINQGKWIFFLSRYAYGFFVGQMLAMRIIKYAHLPAEWEIFWAFMITILFALVEYHLVEKKVVPVLLSYAKKGEATL